MASFCCGGGGGGGGGGGNAGVAPLLGGGGAEDMLVEGMLDYNGTKAIRSKTGGWRSANFTIGVEIAERFAFMGISSNLITYLTGPLHQSTAVAAINVNAWSGTVSMLPLLGAFVADNYLGRYRTILFSSLLYIMGLGLITLSALLLYLSPISCGDVDNNQCPPSQYQAILFFFSLFMVAIAQGGHKPNVQAFGAGQFNPQDPQESKSISSFFNWWNFGLCCGLVFSSSILAYIEDSINWALGFGITCISLVIALIVFLLGRKTYRYSMKEEETRNPFTKIGLVFVVAAKNWRSTLAPSVDVEEETVGRSHQFKFLDKALIDVSDNQDDPTKYQTVCTIGQVTDAKSILRLIPIWCTSLMYGTVFSQATTFFTKQGSTMERMLSPSFQVPSASLLTFTTLSIIFFIPIYDCIFVPIMRVFTKNPSGITTLQRICFGMLLSTITMVMAALVENKRLKTASDFGLVDTPGETVPMSIWWLLPQYCLMGVADVFTRIGLQEFFYDQVPKGLESLGIALYWSVYGVASFLSGFLISIIEKGTSTFGGDSWFSSNLNLAHLDYFYWVLAGLNAVGLVSCIHFSRLYVYNRQNTT